jgi:sugar phosphate isomerase/epimerase
MDLRVGNQTSFAAAHFLDPFRYAIASGFEAFEWFPDRKSSGVGWDEADLGPDLREQLRDQAQANRVRVSLHARWTANPLSLDGRSVLERDLELAKSLGASLLNLHLYLEGGVKAYVDSIAPLINTATANEIDISIENTVETPPQAFNELFDRLLALRIPGTDQVGVCMDIGHANLCSATRNDYLSFIDQLHPSVPIIHLHLHENWGDADTHLPLFTGPAATDPNGITGLFQRLQARGYHGSAILEQWPQPPTLLNAARDRLIRLLRELHQQNHR